MEITSYLHQKLLMKQGNVSQVSCFEEKFCLRLRQLDFYYIQRITDTAEYTVIDATMESDQHIVGGFRIS